MENMDVTRRQFGSEYRSDSTNLRDLLRFSQNDTNETNQLNSEKRGGGNLDRIQSSRTLRDVIKENHKESKNRKSSMSFKDRYIRRQGSGSGSGSEWVSSVPIPTSDVPLHPQNSFRNITRWDSTRKPDSDGSGHPNSDSGSSRLRSATLQRNITIDRPRVRFEELDDEPEEEDMTDEGEKENDKEDQDEDEDEDEDGGGSGSGGGGGGEGGGGEEAPVRMSLMSLLAETESGYAMDEDDEDDEEEGVGEYNNCCVCMVRHKGTAFIPCGHTFCRLCSRELWVQRGNCPLCNNFILEILDIY